MKIESDILNRIKDIQWFVNCGKSVESDVQMNISYTNSWKKAEKHYKKLSWENFTLEVNNDLAAFLRNKYPREYSNWNYVAAEARSFINNEIVPKLELIKEQNELDQDFIGTVSWDILGAIMEETYKNCKKRPTFFLELLRIYESGNFPCGWKNGKFPEGDLVVF
ncbi:hypothetical protein CN514_08615 [Bacillus sp. AFS001701]|uniref:hypothetical protein n=1 Tax=Bacillaceae TaxID=186817 RepID=UPI000BF8A8BB|nr:hypothetical protein [Bacillus sp. AFS001701]PET69532.1 hypothetical protein CN514_08615 [Bacillus sp. AFS001701]